MLIRVIDSDWIIMAVARIWDAKREGDPPGRAAVAAGEIPRAQVTRSPGHVCLEMTTGQGQMHHLGRQRAIASLTILLLASALRTASFDHAKASSAAFEPTFEAVACPPEITHDEASAISCGYLTVPEDRADPNGRRIRLFVLQAAPLDGETLPDPIFIPGRDLVGMSPPFVPWGYRLGRVVISMDRRGAGRSEPSLACPEVRKLDRSGYRRPARFGPDENGHAGRSRGLSRPTHG
jgi:hypothetical protein